MSAGDIRKSLNILNKSIKSDELSEAVPMGFFKTLATKAASRFSDVKAGELKTGQAANDLYRNYLTFLGRIGRKPGTEEVGDMVTFLANNAIPKEIIFNALSRGFSTPQLPVQIKNENDLLNWWNTDIKTDYKNKIGKAFLNVSQEMARLPDNQLSSEVVQDRAQEMVSTAKSIKTKAATRLKSKPRTGTDTKTTSSSTMRASLSIDDIDTALRQLGGL